MFITAGGRPSFYLFMKYVFIGTCLIVSLVLAWHFSTKKYLNPYKLIVVFGKKGCGKSTLLQKLAVYFRKRGYHVYCNYGDSDIKECTPIPIQDLPILAEAGHQLEHYNDPSLYNAYVADFLKKQSNFSSSSKLSTGTHIIKSKNEGAFSASSDQRSDKSKSGGIQPPLPLKSPSVILCDEINLLWDNRNFKNFSPDLQRYFRLQRHYHHVFIGFSQTFDCDKKIRDLADELLICRRVLRVWITCKAYVKKVVVVSPESGNSRETASMTDDFVPLGLFHDLFGVFNAWLPKWVKYHDSFK